MCFFNPEAAIAFYVGHGHAMNENKMCLPTPLINIPINGYLSIHDIPKNKLRFRKLVILIVIGGFAAIIYACFDEIWPWGLIANQDSQTDISGVAAFASLILGAGCIDWFAKIAYRLMLVPQSPKQQGEDGPALFDKDYFRATDMYKK